MARSSRQTGNSGPFSSQLPDGMCFGRVWFIQSYPSVFFSPVQLGRVYPSLSLLWSLLFKKKGQGCRCFPCGFRCSVNLQRLEEQLCSALELCFEPACRFSAYGSARKSFLVKTSIALGLLLTGHRGKTGSSGGL